MGVSLSFPLDVLAAAGVFVLIGVVAAVVRFGGEKIGALVARYASPLGEDRDLRISVRRSRFRGLPRARLSLSFMGRMEWVTLDARTALLCADMLEAAAKEATS